MLEEMVHDAREGCLMPRPPRLGGVKSKVRAVADLREKASLTLPPEMVAIVIKMEDKKRFQSKTLYSP